MKKMFVVSNAAALVVMLSAGARAADPVDFKKQVKPILEANCLKCHGPEKPKGGLSLVNRTGALKGGEKAPALTPNDPAKSPLYTSTTLPADHDDVMPPKGDKLNPTQQATLEAWIEQGAVWPEEFQLAQKERIDFVKQIQPIFEVHCVSCHHEGHAKGDLRMDVKLEIFKSKDIVPGDPQASKVYTTTVLPADHEDLMPPKKKGGPLAKARTDLIRDWIDQGAEWPDGLVLKQREETSSTTRDDKAVFAAVFAKVQANNPPLSAAEMKPYVGVLSGTDGKFDMVPIPAAAFTMGSPDGEKGRKPDEGPAHKVRIEAFWMGATEVRWNEYENFMFPGLEKGTNVTTERINRELYIALTPGPDGASPYKGLEAEAVSRPTSPYVEMSFGMGKEGFPAISMTHFAALNYCRWLTAKTGHFYRLPTEGEWEYACRAGTTTAYSFGDDASTLDEYGWHFKNADSKYQKVGMKKPNPWGLFDMHGNVAEWCLDGYAADAYSKLPPESPWLPGFAEYPHVARGGSWDDEPEVLRSAARRSSDASWKMRDPQLPKSKWYLTDAQFLGFRVVRPLKVPESVEEMLKYWASFPILD
ncbi:MAG: hypothetical protein EXS36_08655 [Pedosphaera sp.]|nr:hypothetical protein [Pedosphaera sp.]